MSHPEDRPALEQHGSTDARIGRQVGGELGEDLCPVVVVLRDAQGDRVRPMPLALGEDRRLTPWWH